MAGQNLEDEMSRFEREIAGVSQDAPAAATTGPSLRPPFVVGANTFSNVQEQLASLRSQVYGAGGPASHPPGANVMRGAAPALSRPPAPPPVFNGGPAMTASMPFMPPQIRSRGPGLAGGGPSQGPSLTRPPRAGQPSQAAAASANSSLSSGPVRYNTDSKPPPTMQPTKIVYASKPVLNKDKVSGAAVSQPSREQPAPMTSAAPGTNRKRELDEMSALPADVHKPPPMAAEASQPSAPAAKKEKKKKEKKFVRTAANEVWEDQSLADWDPNDFRIFCGDLGNEVTDEKLAEAFKKYPSLQRAKVIRDRRTHKTKGYGFLSFKDPADYTRAIREMNGKYVGNRPIKLRKSNWRDRNVEVVKKKEKEKKRLGFR